MVLKIHLRGVIYCNISVVVEFQRCWVLKSKVFAQKSTWSNENLLITLNHLWFSVVSKKFWRRIWDQWHKLIGKNTHIHFFYFWLKNKRVWAKKLGKERKNSKNIKVAANIYFTHYFKNFTWKIKIIKFYYSNYWVS